MSRDLDDCEEVAELMRRFYRCVAQDDLIGPMFTDVARVDWSEHLPKLTAFWCRFLFSEPGYEGNPYRAHLAVHAKASFTTEHFHRWLDLFEDAVESGWTGPHAERAKEFAWRVATVHCRQLTGEVIERTEDLHPAAR